MATTDGSTSIDPTDTDAAAARRRARTATEQRQKEAAASDDPEVIAADIEKTREELSVTLDAIADKVSPKRVAGRTKQKVGDAVKDGAESAAASVRSGAASVKGAVQDKKESLQDRRGSGSVAAPVTPDLRPVPPPYEPPTGAGMRLGPPALAGAAAALVVALLVLRRRRSSSRSRWR